MILKNEEIDKLNKKYPYNNSIYFLIKQSIIICQIKYSPKKPICKNCDFYKPCKEYHKNDSIYFKNQNL